MNNYSGSSRPIKQLLVVLSVIVLAWCVYLIVSAFLVASKTGTIKVTAANKNAVISISQENHNAKIIGIGQANVRLNPGKYQLAATLGSKEVVKSVTVQKGNMTSLQLSPNKAFHLPSVEDIDFQNIQALKDQGLTQEQINTLKLYFFSYKHHASIVNINASSVRQATHELGAPFVLNFSVVVDSQPLKARITYAGLNDVSLELRDPGSGKIVHKSGG